MLISEIFYSLQGEGALAGVPSVFIRTAGCPLRCGWCDTPHAAAQARGRELDISEILARISPHPTRHCVITGGEPLMAYDIAQLATALHAKGYHITIETAGILLPRGIACNLASLSPKLSHSHPTDHAWFERHERNRLQPHVLRQWMESYNYQLKFVVQSRADTAEIDDVLAKIDLAVPPEKILLMPEGVSHRNAEDIAALCLERGYRYCDRLHIRLFGDVQGK